MKNQVNKFNKIKSILDGPVIKGVKLKDPSETLYNTRPKNRIEYERNSRNITIKII